jgi:ABC-type ATPase with predicted acetyltransferase domain
MFRETFRADGTEEPWKRGRGSVKWVAAGVPLTVSSAHLFSFRQEIMNEEQHARAGGDDRLPETYDEFITHPMARRRAIYARLSAGIRSRLWLEQLLRYRAKHTQLTAEQRAILDEIEATMRDEETFLPGSGPDPELDRLSEAAITVFGKDEARKLLATLGPEDAGGTCAIR